MIVIGIDPGTGKRSGTGLAVFDTETKQILLATVLMPESKNKRAAQRILRDLSKKVELVFSKLGSSAKLACIETFVMQGRGGQTLHELRGALMSAIPYETDLEVVYNTTVKKVVAGHGGADKAEVGYGVCDFFSSNMASEKRVRSLIEDSEWDAIDALAIGIAGYLNSLESGAK